VKLPADLYFQKDYRIQWWYFTAILLMPTEEFGYEVTFFAAGVRKNVPIEVRR
jgi:predicted secreted hydrolase